VGRPLRGAALAAATLKSISQGLGDKAYCVGTHFSLADIAVGCALGYLDFRFPQNDWRAEYPNIVRLADKLAARQSFIDTLPPAA
jgi:glutathione S-transferase